MNSANVANVIKGIIIPEGHTTEGFHFPCRYWEPRHSWPR